MISIHAPTRGATKILEENGLTMYDISIHAPTRGATTTQQDNTSLFINFNPRSHEGSDVQVPFLYS